MLRAPSSARHRPVVPLPYVVAALALVSALPCRAPAVAPGARQAPTPGDMARQTAALFAGDPGAAAGDANADARATAADLAATLADMRSPVQPGPWGVGLQRITVSKPSVTEPGVTRTLESRIWYPADPAVAAFDRRPSGTTNAPRAPGLTRVPLLVFSHGSCGIPNQSVFLTARLASHGFVVVAPPHPGNTLGEFATCSTPAQILDSYQNRPADVSFVIDAMLALSADPGSFFADLIDPERIGVLGHSFGGLTTLRVAALDPRITAGLALAPALFDVMRDEVAGIRIPMMIQGGTLDSRTPFGPTALAAYELLGPPRFLVEILQTGHYAFSDLCVTSPECGTPDTLTQPEAHGYVLRYAVPFLLRYVAGDARLAAHLAPASAPPGVRFLADAG